MYYLGIDPGAKGGFAVLKGHDIEYYSMFEKQTFLNCVYSLSKKQERTASLWNRMSGN